MNYYRRFMGDYASKTADLSLAEHGAYNVLLDTCYSTERPLPGGHDALYRLCRAMSKDEQQAVRNVADRFFPLAGDGMRHNPRAEEEIAKAQATIAKQRESGVESAAKRWSTDGSTHKSTEAGAIQPPTTILQPLTPNSKRDKDIVGLTPDPVNGKRKEFAKQAVEIIGFLNTKAGRNYQPVKQNVDLVVGLLNGGVTADDIRSVVAKKVREWKDKPEMETYLRPATLFGPKNFHSKYHGELVAK